MDETVEQCAKRELKEETGIEVDKIEQVYTASKVDRDPRGRVISVIFYSIVDKASVNPIASDDAASLQWFNINKLPALAFDHDEVMKILLKKIASLRSQ